MHCSLNLLDPLKCVCAYPVNVNWIHCTALHARVFPTLACQAVLHGHTQQLARGVGLLPLHVSANRAPQTATFTLLHRGKLATMVEKCRMGLGQQVFAGLAGLAHVMPPYCVSCVQTRLKTFTTGLPVVVGPNNTEDFSL
jgi:hypothetical protein